MCDEKPKDLLMAHQDTIGDDIDPEILAAIGNRGLMPHKLGEKTEMPNDAYHIDKDGKLHHFREPLIPKQGLLADEEENK